MFESEIATALDNAVILEFIGRQAHACAAANRVDGSASQSPPADNIDGFVSTGQGGD
jgi:hypothetical protein